MDKYVTKGKRKAEDLNEPTKSSDESDSSDDGRPENINSGSKRDGSQENTEMFQETSDSAKESSLKKIIGKNLDCHYWVNFYSKVEADHIFKKLEEEVVYYDAEVTKVKVYGKLREIHRQQVAFGNESSGYRFSGITLPAKPWIGIVDEIRKKLVEFTGINFNFALVNKYKDGNDYIGEHRDDEKDLVKGSPIASMSFGQEREFVLRHGETRGSRAGKARRSSPEPVKILLKHGSLFMMNSPTNTFWYHSLPVRKNITGARINLTFRCLKSQ